MNRRAGGANPRAPRHRLEDWLREAATVCWPELQPPVVVRAHRARRRAHATMEEFVLSSGGVQRRVLVKAAGSRNPPALPDAVEVPPDRPRLYPVTKSAEEVQLEYGVLAEMDRHFRGLGDPRFGSVRILGQQRGGEAFAMEKVGDPPLSWLMPQALLCGSATEALLSEAFRHAGAWLQAWHRHPGLPHTSASHTHRDELVDGIDRLACHLASVRGESQLLARVREATAAAALRVLPAELPSGTAHGDYAPRNVLVGSSGRVTVIDTPALWRAAVYADVGHFLFSLHAWRPHVYTGGLVFGRWIGLWQAEFLQGYFGEPRAPHAAIALFEIEALLDKWTAETMRARRKGGPRGRRWRFAVWDKYLAGLLGRQLQALA